MDSPPLRGAETVGRSSRGYDAGKKMNGRKRHIAVGTCGPIPAVLITGAGVQNRDGARPLFSPLHAYFTSIRLIWADSGYAGQFVGWASGQLKPMLQIVTKLAGQTTFVILHRRWAGEQTFSWIKPMSAHRPRLRTPPTAVAHSNLDLYGQRLRGPSAMKDRSTPSSSTIEVNTLRAPRVASMQQAATRCSAAFLMQPAGEALPEGRGKPSEPTTLVKLQGLTSAER